MPKPTAPTPADRAFERLRALCYALPAVEEKLSHGSPSFFVRGKMFCSFANDAYGEGLAAWCKASPERQQALVAEDPARYFVPPYVGVKGWVGVRIDAARADWDALALILEEGFTQVAPKSVWDSPVLPPPPAKPLPTTDPELARAALSRLEALSAELSGSSCEREGKHATFRVNKKPFAYFLDNHHGDGIIAVSVRAPDGENEALIAEHPERFFMPAYIGVRGWVGVRLDQKKVDWKDVAARLARSHAQVAPKPRSRK